MPNDKVSSDICQRLVTLSWELATKIKFMESFGARILYIPSLRETASVSFIKKDLIFFQGPFDGKGGKECPICMGELNVGDPVRFLPCLHCYHVECIDDWLQRSLTCPSCLEPVDAALLSSYQAP